MFGLSYLPTAGRLSFSVVKAAGLKYQEVTEDLDNFSEKRDFHSIPLKPLSLPPVPYVRVLQLNQSGRVVKKKKTSIRKGSKDPAFNETLTFDVPQSQLETAAFWVLVSHKELSLDLASEMDSTSSAVAVTPPRESVVSLSAAESGAYTDRSDYSSSSLFGRKRSSSAGPRNYRDQNGRVGDACLGRVCVGAAVRGERERAHWTETMAAPRSQVTRWHALR